MSDEAVKKQIEGVCDEISEKNGWVQFSVNVGSQYPIRLSTKLPALIEQGRAAGNQRAVWTFKESQGGENPNKPGTFFTNRYMEGVEVGGTVDPAQAASPPSRNGGTSSPDETRSSIERQTVLKAAMTMYEQFADDDQFFAFCEAAAAFVADRPLPPVINAAGGTADDIPFD